MTLQAGLAGKSARRKREAYIRHWVAEGEDPEQVVVAHQGGQARPLHTPRTWEPNPGSSGDEVEVIEYPEPGTSLSELGTVSLVPQSALYQPVRSVGLVPKARASSDPYGKGGKAVSSSSPSVGARPKAVSKASSSVVETGT